MLLIVARRTGRNKRAVRRIRKNNMHRYRSEFVRLSDVSFINLTNVDAMDIKINNMGRKFIRIYKFSSENSFRDYYEDNH